MVEIAEATLSKAMKFAYDSFIAPLDTEHLLDYRPVTQQDTDWLHDNPATGVIYLKKHPNAKVAWVLVKFEQRKTNVLGQHQVAHSNVKISSPEEFETFFKTKLSPDFEFPNDMTIYVRWDKENVLNKRYNRDFDETTPNFYMYTNHHKANLPTLIKRLYRINDIIDTNPKAIIGNQFNIPDSATKI